ncbi:MAG: hypothetical protein RIQ41_35 [Candidatus Parcubacteria bacterium]|jgi:hypothetical protein
MKNAPSSTEDGALHREETPAHHLLGGTGAPTVKLDFMVRR